MNLYSKLVDPSSNTSVGVKLRFISDISSFLILPSTPLLAPTLYPVPASIVIVTVSSGSKMLSAFGFTMTLTSLSPAPNCTVLEILS